MLIHEIRKRFLEQYGKYIRTEYVLKDCGDKMHITVDYVGGKTKV